VDPLQAEVALLHQLDGQETSPPVAPSLDWSHSFVTNQDRVTGGA